MELREKLAKPASQGQKWKRWKGWEFQLIRSRTNWREKLIFGVNLTEIERIRRPWTKMKETLIFKNLINSIRGVIEDNNLYLESIWPKFT